MVHSNFGIARVRIQFSTCLPSDSERLVVLDILLLDIHICWSKADYSTRKYISVIRRFLIVFPYILTIYIND